MVEMQPVQPSQEICYSSMMKKKSYISQHSIYHSHLIIKEDSSLFAQFRTSECLYHFLSQGKMVESLVHESNLTNLFHKTNHEILFISILELQVSVEDFYSVISEEGLLIKDC